MEIQEFVSRSHIDAPILNAWIEEQWLLPLSSGTRFQFSDADLARALLIQDLRLDFGVNDEGIGIILHLLDQVHGLRCLVRDIHAMEMSHANDT
jgi:chaperone modulatory protein CbpM